MENNIKYLKLECVEKKINVLLEKTESFDSDEASGLFNFTGKFEQEDNGTKYSVSIKNDEILFNDEKITEFNIEGNLLKLKYLNDAYTLEAKDYILEVEHLKEYFPTKTNLFGKPLEYLKAVDDVSFKLERGKTIGIVGESGCGKTTLGRTILKLYKQTDGRVLFEGRDLSNVKGKELLDLRCDIQLVFQDPYSSLSPRMTVGEIISEAVYAHHIVPKNEVKEYVLEIMEKCGLQRHFYDRYPHEFSGGQRQRICIARALAVKPKLVICDEPVSALDVSIQAQIINLLKKLQKEENLSYIFISHDLSVVKYISNSIGVMYLGSLVETGSKKNIFTNPLHPYTEALFSAVPVADPNIKMNRIILKGDLPSPANPPKGCKFNTRCNKCMDICKTTAPRFIEIEKDHFVACHLYDNTIKEESTSEEK